MECQTGLVFLGDVGSYALGVALAILGAYSVLQSIPVGAVLGPLVLYIADTALDAAAAHPSL